MALNSQETQARVRVMLAGSSSNTYCFVRDTACANLNIGTGLALRLEVLTAASSSNNVLSSVTEASTSDSTLQDLYNAANGDHSVACYSADNVDAANLLACGDVSYDNTSTSLSFGSPDLRPKSPLRPKKAPKSQAPSTAPLRTA